MTAEFVMNAKYALIPRKQRLRSVKDCERERRTGADKNSEREGAARENGFDPYQVLKITRGASKEEIKTAYLNLIKQYHPDKVSHLGRIPETNEKATINRAYQIFSNNPVNRKKLISSLLGKHSFIFFVEEVVVCVSCGNR
jgi:DnaJ-class molecular chaperone